MSPDDEAKFLSRAAADNPYIKLWVDYYPMGGYYCVYKDININQFDETINNRISSIEVFNGAQVLLCCDAYFSGQMIYVYENIPDLRIYDYNDCLSSLKWYPAKHFAILYEDSDYKGKTIPLLEDPKNLVSDKVQDFNYPHKLDNAISSVRVYGGTEVTLYELTGYSGFYREFTCNEPNLANCNLDNIASSAQISNPHSDSISFFNPGSYTFRLQDKYMWPIKSIDRIKATVIGGGGGASCYSTVQDNGSFCFCGTYYPGGAGGKINTYGDPGIGGDNCSGTATGSVVYRLLSEFY